MALRRWAECALRWKPLRLSLLLRSIPSATRGSTPNVAAGLAAAAIPIETVDALARAADAISPEAVDSDLSLLSKAGSRPADLAARDIRQWVRHHRTAKDADNQLSEQRKCRRAAWFEGDDGMFVVHSVFDPVTGAAVRAQLDAETDRLWRSDGGRDGSPNDLRSSAQRRCDAVARVPGATSPHEADIVDVAGPAGRIGATVIVVADVGVIDGNVPDGRCEILGTGPGARVGVVSALTRHHLARRIVRRPGEAIVARTGPTSGQPSPAIDRRSPRSGMRQLRGTGWAVPDTPCEGVVWWWIHRRRKSRPSLSAVPHHGP